MITTKWRQNPRLLLFFVRQSTESDSPQHQNTPAHIFPYFWRVELSAAFPLFALLWFQELLVTIEGWCWNTVLTIGLKPKFREFHFHFSFQQHQSSRGLCTGAAVLVQVFWFLSAALHVLVCFLPSNLSFIKLHHAAPRFHSVFVWRFFFPPPLFLSRFLEGVLGRHSTHSSSFQQTQLVLGLQTTPLRLRPFALDLCSQAHHVGQQGCGGRGHFKSSIMAPARINQG